MNRRAELPARRLLRMMKSPMTRKLRLLSCVVAAVAALMAGRSPFVAGARAWSGSTFYSFHNHSAAKQLPQGFTLPSSDLDVKVSSLVAADLDADGDLDVVAAQHVHGVVNIVVWENDGAGRLTRRQPSPPKTLSSEPSAPSIDEGGGATAASIQPETAAIAPSCEAGRLRLPELTCERPRAPDASSADVAGLRSRSPPLNS